MYTHIVNMFKCLLILVFSALVEVAVPSFLFP